MARGETAPEIERTNSTSTGRGLAPKQIREPQVPRSEPG